MSKGLEQCDKCDYFISVEDAYKQGKEEAFNKMSSVCKHRQFTFDRDSHCSGYYYCMLKGFNCVCNFGNCDLVKEG